MEDKIFGRINDGGNVDLLHYETGEAVTRYPGCWPLNSDLGGGYEHAEGIKLSIEDARKLKIEIEDDPRGRLKLLAETWNASGEYDDTEFIGRYFLNDTDLDEFAQKHGLTLNDGTEDQDNHDPVKIMKFYDCELIYDYPGSNPNRQFGDVETVFNEANE